MYLEYWVQLGAINSASRLSVLKNAHKIFTVEKQAFQVAGNFIPRTLAAGTVFVNLAGAESTMLSVRSFFYSMGYLAWYLDGQKE